LIRFNSTLNFVLRVVARTCTADGPVWDHICLWEWTFANARAAIVHGFSACFPIGAISNGTIAMSSGVLACPLVAVLVLLHAPVRIVIAITAVLI
jgi:hypothetical protein